MQILLENPTQDTVSMLMRSWPPGYCFYYKGNDRQIILTCDNYINDFQAQSHIFTYTDNYIKINMVLPYHECPTVKKFY